MPAYVELTKKLERARWWCLRNQTFYGQALFGLKDVFQLGIGTACTDGKCIRWEPGFLDSLTDEETRFVLLHELLHCVHFHLWRLPHDKNGNIAGDYIINLVLSRIQGIKMPAKGLVCPKEFEKLAEEEIWRKLEAADRKQEEKQKQKQQKSPQVEEDGDGEESDEGESAPQKQSDDSDEDQDGDGDADEDGDAGDDPGNGKNGKQSDGEGDGGQGSGEPSDCGDFSAPAEKDQPEEGEPESDTDLRQDWERRVVQAAMACSASKGDLPADATRILDRIRRQEVDWRREMADFVRDTVAAKNDWCRPARRTAWQVVIYPKKKTDDLALCIFVRDTSGSISTKLCSEFNGLIEDCLADTGCRGLLIDCDACIHEEYPLEPGQDVPQTAKGGGGTDFRPVFTRVKELEEAGERIAGVVYLTDGYGSYGDETPDVSVLWLMTSGTIAPFGKTVKVLESYS